MSPALVGLAGAAVQSTSALREQHDRDEEVRHHEAGLELEQHGEPTEHRLREHAGDEPEREPDEVASRCGARTRLPSTATITAIDTSPVNIRFTNSTIVL